MRPSAFLLLPFLLGSSVAFAGLDVTAYDKLVLLKSPPATESDVGGEANVVVLQRVEFPERFEGLKDGGVYRYGQSFDFRAGAYSGYGRWRNELAKLAGSPQTPFKSFDGKIELRYDATVWDRKAGPFWELIDFSDAEGVIGPVVCKRVYQDFLRFADAASRHPDPDFRASYEDWKKAFAMCADGGAIVFH